MAPALVAIKRGSFQVQKAAKAVNEYIGSQQLICIFVITGFVLCGIVEQSASVALRANSTSAYSAAEFAEYVENTSYITRYCLPLPEKNETSTHVARSIPHIELWFGMAEEAVVHAVPGPSKNPQGKHIGSRQRLEEFIITVNA